MVLKVKKYIMMGCILGSFALAAHAAPMPSLPTGPDPGPVTPRMKQAQQSALQFLKAQQNVQYATGSQVPGIVGSSAPKTKKQLTHQYHKAVKDLQRHGVSTKDLIKNSNKRGLCDKGCLHNLLTKKYKEGVKKQASYSAQVKKASAIARGVYKYNESVKGLKVHPAVKSQ